MRPHDGRDHRRRARHPRLDHRRRVADILQEICAGRRWQTAVGRQRRSALRRAGADLHGRPALRRSEHGVPDRQYRLRRGRAAVAEIPRRAGDRHALDRRGADHPRRRPPRRPGLMLSVGFVSSAGEIDAALWEGCFPPPLEGRWWYETLERSRLQDQFHFLYAVIREADAPVGIAPLFVMNFPVSLVAPDALKPLLPLIGSLAHPKTLFVGSPCADEGTVGLLPSVDRRAALLALQQGVNAKAKELNAPLIVLKDVPPALAAEVAALGGMFRVESFPGTLVELGAD